MCFFCLFFFFFFFKQKTAYEMVGSDWSSDVCSSDLRLGLGPGSAPNRLVHDVHAEHRRPVGARNPDAELVRGGAPWILRDVQDVAVRRVGLRDAIEGRQPADAPFRGRQRTLVFDLHAPPLGEIAIALEAGTLKNRWVPGSQNTSRKVTS